MGVKRRTSSNHIKDMSTSDLTISGLYHTHAHEGQRRCLLTCNLQTGWGLGLLWALKKKHLTTLNYF